MENFSISYDIKLTFKISDKNKELKFEQLRANVLKSINDYVRNLFYFDFDGFTFRSRIENVKIESVKSFLTLYFINLERRENVKIILKDVKEKESSYDLSIFFTIMSTITNFNNIQRFVDYIENNLRNVFETSLNNDTTLEQNSQILNESTTTTNITNSNVNMEKNPKMIYLGVILFVCLFIANFFANKYFNKDNENLSVQEIEKIIDKKIDYYDTMKNLNQGIIDLNKRIDSIEKNSNTKTTK